MVSREVWREKKHPAWVLLVSRGEACCKVELQHWRTWQNNMRNDPKLTIRKYIPSWSIRVWLRHWCACRTLSDASLGDILTFPTRMAGRSPRNLPCVRIHVRWLDRLWLLLRNQSQSVLCVAIPVVLPGLVSFDFVAGFAIVTPITSMANQ